jgi:predicted enzyme related to lactoylglutathione lyase
MNTDIEGSINFFYYDNLDEASRFYGEAMGFEKVLDVGFAQLFKVYDNVHVGLVDGSRGSMKPTEDKSVMLSFFVEDVEECYRRLKDRGLELSPPME